MMARRMMRKHHVRCRAGEKVEITSKPYLSLSLIEECGKMLAKGPPKKDKNGNIMKDKSGKVVHEPYVIKVLNTINFPSPFITIHLLIYGLKRYPEAGYNNHC